MDYNAIAQLALNMLTKYGQTVLLRQLAGGGSAVYDPTTGVVTQGTPVDAPRQGLIVDNTGKKINKTAGDHYASGALIVDTDKWMYIDANGADPRTQDQIVVKGNAFQIMDVQTMEPGGIPLIHLIVLRK